MTLLGNEPPIESELETTDGTAATFTAWMTGGRRMRGVVAGAVGAGEFVGKVLDLTAGAVTATEAVYNVIGTEHAFAALVHVEQAGPKGTISGVVTDGWGKGRPVSGEFTEIQCDHDSITTDCWRGTLRIARAAAI